MPRKWKRRKNMTSRKPEEKLKYKYVRRIKESDMDQQKRHQWMRNIRLKAEMKNTIYKKETVDYIVLGCLELVKARDNTGSSIPEVKDLQKWQKSKQLRSARNISWTHSLRRTMSPFSETYSPTLAEKWKPRNLTSLWRIRKRYIVINIAIAWKRNITKNVTKNMFKYKRLVHRGCRIWRLK